MEEKIIKALESVVRLGSILLTQAVEKEQLTPTQVIACDGLVKPWAPGPFTRGDVRTERTPSSQRALWVPFHTTDPTEARPYIAPTMAEDAYQKDEVMLWTDGTVRRSKQDGVVHGPDVLPDAWETVEQPMEV